MCETKREDRIIAVKCNQKVTVLPRHFEQENMLQLTLQSIFLDTNCQMESRVLSKASACLTPRRISLHSGSVLAPTARKWPFFERPYVQQLTEFQRFKKGAA